MRVIPTLMLLICIFGSPREMAAQSSNDAPSSSKPSYQEIVAQRLPLYGHRNWIVIADSAYPAQTATGIETVYTGKQQLEVVEHVLKAVSRAKHVRPVIHIDRELKFVSEKHAEGIGDYRAALEKLLANHSAAALPHEDIIAKLDEAGSTFRVLILKTDLTLPYTSVFIRLDAGYWSAEAEAALRKELPPTTKKMNDEKHARER